MKDYKIEKTTQINKINGVEKYYYSIFHYKKFLGIIQYKSYYEVETNAGNYITYVTQYIKEINTIIERLKQQDISRAFKTVKVEVI